MFCKKCGKQIADDSEFCTYCGVRIKAAKMEDIIRDEDDADGDSYIAVKPDMSDVSKTQEEQKASVTDEPALEKASQVSEQSTHEPVADEMKSFVDEDEKGNSNKKLAWIAAILAIIVVIVCVAVYFSMFRKKGNNDLVLSEQTTSPAPLVTTAKQTETQAQEQKNGYFERTYNDKSTYKGNFTDGVWDGKGIYTSSTGVVYDGTFTKGAITGSGTIYYTNGDEYKGDYKNAQRDGQGSLFSADGTKYSGGFVADKKSGQGEVWYINGDYFSGKFVNDVKQGYGEYVYVNGSTYKGYYQDDVMHGEGTLTYTNGDYFRGAFAEGQKNGRGEYHLYNGDIISGNWSGDETTGYFTYFNAQTGETEDNVYFEEGQRK